uniref:Uncharacterized protein n=1 Tax=Rhizophora mucronata TaxID=61149 RepID=A0A2P2NU97_RHIMU
MIGRNRVKLGPFGIVPFP